MDGHRGYSLRGTGNLDAGWPSEPLPTECGIGVVPTLGLLYTGSGYDSGQPWNAGNLLIRINDLAGP